MFNGQVTGLSKISGGVPASFCRKASSFNLTMENNMIENPGIGDQLQVIAGMGTFSLSWSCVGPEKTDVARWFPTTAGVVPADFPDFLVTVDDGTDGFNLVLNNCIPSSATITHAEGTDVQAEYEFEILFTHAVRHAPGTYTPVYNVFLGHGPADCLATIDADEDYDVVSYELSMDLGTEIHNPKKEKSVGEKRRVDGFYVTQNDCSLSLVTRNPVEVGIGNIPVDIPDEYDISLSLSNGTVAQDMTVLCDDFYMAEEAVEVEAIGAVGFNQTFRPGSGTMSNRVSIS